MVGGESKKATNWPRRSVQCSWYLRAWEHLPTGRPRSTSAERGAKHIDLCACANGIVRASGSPESTASRRSERANEGSMLVRETHVGSQEPHIHPDSLLTEAYHASDP